jgi:integrase
MMPTMETKPLFIPESKKWKGLKIFCYRCKTNVSEICKTSGKPLSQCKHGDKHVYKVIVHVSGTKNGRRTKKLDTRDLNEAIKQAIEFEKEAKSSEYLEKKNAQKIEEKPKQVQQDNRPYLLIHALARYIGWMNGEGVPEHEIRERSPEHIKDVERGLKLWIECMKENNYNLNTLEVGDITNETVGKVFAFLKKKGYAARTFNKQVGFYISFMSWYSKEYDVPIRNYFERIHKKNLNPKPESITFKEFEALLDKVTPENGLKEYPNGVKPERNLYRPWLIAGFRLALETGRRREEITNMRWNDIKESEGTQYILIEDYKINRIQNRISDEEKKYNYIPVTHQLKKLLDELGYHIYKGMDAFILAPDIKISRGRVMSDILSRGFTHYYDQLNAGRKLTFKSLRKTYITHMELFIGRGNTKIITGHTNDGVIANNYISQKEIAKAAHVFEIFPDEPERNQELQDIRTTIKKEKEPKNLER